MDEKQATFFEHTDYKQAIVALYVSGEPVYVGVDQQSGLTTDGRLNRSYDAMFNFENVEQINSERIAITDVSVFTWERPFKLTLTPFDVFRVVLKDPSKPFRAVAVLATDRAESFPYPEGYKVFEGHLLRAG